MKLATKVLSFAKPTGERLHPMVIHTCKTVEDFIGCLDTTIHFSIVHATADKVLQKYPIQKIIKKSENIIIPEEVERCGI